MGYVTPFPFPPCSNNLNTPDLLHISITGLLLTWPLTSSYDQMFKGNFIMRCKKSKGDEQRLRCILQSRDNIQLKILQKRSLLNRMMSVDITVNASN